LSDRGVAPWCNEMRPSATGYVSRTCGLTSGRCEAVFILSLAALHATHRVLGSCTGYLEVRVLQTLTQCMEENFIAANRPHLERIKYATRAVECTSQRSSHLEPAHSHPAGSFCLRTPLVGSARMLSEEPHSSHIQTSKPAEWPTSGGLLLCGLAVFHFIEDDAALTRQR
jgi:hypothetical protein